MVPMLAAMAPDMTEHDAQLSLPVVAGVVELMTKILLATVALMLPKVKVAPVNVVVAPKPVLNITGVLYV